MDSLVDGQAYHSPVNHRIRGLEFANLSDEAGIDIACPIRRPPLHLGKSLGVQNCVAAWAALELMQAVAFLSNRKFHRRFCAATIPQNAAPNHPPLVAPPLENDF